MAGRYADGKARGNAAIPALVGYLVRLERYAVCICLRIGWRTRKGPDLPPIPHEEMDAGIRAQRIRPESRKQRFAAAAVRKAMIR